MLFLAIIFSLVLCYQNCAPLGSTFIQEMSDSAENPDRDKRTSLFYSSTKQTSLTASVHCGVMPCWGNESQGTVNPAKKETAQNISLHFD